MERPAPLEADSLVIEKNFEDWEKEERAKEAEAREEQDKYDVELAKLVATSQDKEDDIKKK